MFRPLHYSDVEIRIPDITKSRELLSWEPQVDLDEGLERTLEWYTGRPEVAMSDAPQVRLARPDLGEAELAAVAARASPAAT